MPDSTMHVNELLTYCSFYMNNSTIDNIKKIINLFYSEDDIIDAKKTLWEIAKDDLGVFPVRKDTNKRTSSLAHVNDIFEALMKLDGMDKMPVFVAINIMKLPDRQPEELNLLSMVDRLSDIEKRIKNHEDILTSHAIDILSFKDNKISKPTIEITDTMLKNDNLNKNYNEDVKTPRINTNLTKSVLKNADIKENLEMKTYSKTAASATSLTTPGTVKKHVDAINSVWTTDNGLNENTNKDDLLASNLDDKGNIIDEDGFILYESKAQRKLRHKRENDEIDSILEGAPPPPDYVFLSRLVRGNSSTIANFL